MTRFICVIVFCFAFFSSADMLNIEKIAKYDEKEQIFIVQETFEVQPNDRLVIPAGQKVYFAPLVCLDIKGELVIDGKPHEPVLLMSRRAALGSGAAHDWGGIKVFQGGSVDARYAVISNATAGIKSCCDNVTLLNVSFHTNGEHLRIGDRRITVFDREPVSYEKVPTKINIETNRMGVDYDAIAGKKYLPTRLWVLGPIALACVGTGAVYMSKWSSSAKEYDNYDPRAAGDSYSEGQERLKKLRSDVNTNKWLGISAMGVGLSLGGYVTWYTIKF